MQGDVDAENERLQQLLTAAETAPDADKLQADIQPLRAQLAEEKKKDAVLAGEMAGSQDVIAKRDAVLGLTDLKSQTQRESQEAKAITDQEAKAREATATLEQSVAGVQSKLVQLRQRDGKLWLIPEQASTTKEPIIAMVSGSGVKLERFNRPEETKEFDEAKALADFDAYLDGLKAANQYVVFLVRPSGIDLFKKLLIGARARDIEVGFDALEENKDIYFSTPPVIDETVPATANPAGPVAGAGGDAGTAATGGGRNQAQEAKNGGGARNGTNGPGGSAAPSAAAVNGGSAKASKPAPPPVVKSWWQRFLEWIGYE